MTATEPAPSSPQEPVQETRSRPAGSMQRIVAGFMTIIAGIVALLNGLTTLSNEALFRGRMLISR